MCAGEVESIGPKWYFSSSKIIKGDAVLEDFITKSYLHFDYRTRYSTVKVDLSQYLGHILVETAKTFSLFLNLQTPVELSNESNYGFDYDYKILQCS